MFPLGTVLFPGEALPLRVFEPRFQQLVDEVLVADEPFGIVLIERGSEVGGGDQRYSVGTRAYVEAVGDLEGGHRAVVVRGRERFRATRWFPDDPYPIAEVEPLVDKLCAIPDRDETVAALRRAYGLMARLGHDLDDHCFDDLPADPVDASWRLAAACPVGSFDAQEILETTSVKARLALIRQHAEDQALLCEMRLGG